MSIRTICVEFVHDHVGAPLGYQDSNRHAQNESAHAGARITRNAQHASGDDGERTASLKEMCEGVGVAPAKNGCGRSQCRRWKATHDRARADMNETALLVYGQVFADDIALGLQLIKIVDWHDSDSY